MRPRTLRARTVFVLGTILAGAAATGAALVTAGIALRASLSQLDLSPRAIADMVAATRGAMLIGAAVGGALAVAAAVFLGGRFSRTVLRMRAALHGGARAGHPETVLSSIAELNALARAASLVAGDLRARLALADRQREEMASLVDAVGEGIVQLGPDGRVVRANAAARALLSFPPRAERQPIASLVRHAELREVLEHAVRTGAAEAREVAWDARRLLVLARPLAAAAPQAGGTAVVIVDLTELRRLEGVRRDFVANASHELKTPLTSIRGYAETLMEDDALPAETRLRFLDTIARNAGRLQQIVDDLLDLSRLESGGWRPELEPVDAMHIARDAWAPFRERAAQADVEVIVPAAPARVLADARGLGQIFTNLFDNALRHTPPGGRIEVRVSRDFGDATLLAARRAARAAAPASGVAAGAACVVLEVADTGSGIPGDALPRIFERFYRVDPARSRAEGGTGLGLSIVRHMVESMGGEVGAESQLGRGTTIRLRLPAPAPPAEAVTHA